ENINPRSFWTKFSEGSPLLRHFAIKIFAIVPHLAAIERLFSSLGLVKTKLRNRISPNLTRMLGILRYDLQQEPYFEEFDEEFLQISIKETNMELIDENKLAINSFFNTNTFEQNQNQMEIIEENLANNSQRSTNSVED
ncbi:38130_t:CDS:2, partial [Gigaspora margarita]